MFQPDLPPEQRPITFHSHYTREAGAPLGQCSFLVVLNDTAIVSLAKSSPKGPVRMLRARFNAAAKPSSRLQALFEAVKEAEDLNLIVDRSPPSIVGRIINFINPVAVFLGFVAGMVAMALAGYLFVSLVQWSDMSLSR